MKKISISWLLVNVWFFLFVTRTEFPALGTFAGLSYTLRGIAGFLLFMHLSLLHGIRPKLRSLSLAILLATFFLAGNFSDPSLFALIASFGIMIGLVLAGLLQGPKSLELFTKLVQIYIKVNLVGLLLAAATYYGAGLEIDFHGLMFPWSSSRAQEFMGFFRITGFQVEPGTYTATIHLFILMSAVLRGQMFGRLETIAMLSTLGTMSAWAAFAIASYTAGCLIEAIQRRSHRTIITKWVVVIIALVPLLSLIEFTSVENAAYIQYFFDRLSTENASGSMVLKLQAWEAWKSQLDSGMLFPRSLNESFCPFCLSPQDLGTLINFIWYAGLVFAVPFLALLGTLAIRHLGLSLLVASLPLVIAKFYFFDPALWLYFGMLLFLPTSLKKRRGNQLRKKHGEPLVDRYK